MYIELSTNLVKRLENNNLHNYMLLLNEIIKKSSQYGTICNYILLFNSVIIDLKKCTIRCTVATSISYFYCMLKLEFLNIYKLIFNSKLSK